MKKKYRPAAPVPEGDQAVGAAGTFATDTKGNPVIDVIQTVRSGFYLIDIPLYPESD